MEERGRRDGEAEEKMNRWGDRMEDENCTSHEHFFHIYNTISQNINTANVDYSILPCT